MIDIQYDEQLSKLLENQDNISYFCDLLNGEFWYEKAKRKKLIDKVINFCAKNNLDEALAWMYYYLGWYYSEFAEYKNSIELFKTARDIFIKNDNKKGLVFVYNGLISIYCENGQYELANELGILAISIAKELNDTDLITKLFLNTSITNLLNKEYEYAKEILEYTVKFNKLENQKDTYKIVYYKTLADIELNLLNFDMAYTCIQNAMEIDKKYEENVYTVELYRLLGCYYGMIKQIERAEGEFEHSCSIAEKGSYLTEKCETLIEWAKFKFNYGDNENAVDILVDVINISTKKKFNRLIKVSSILLYDYYNKIKSHKQALDYLELYLTVDKEIQNYNNMNYVDKINFANNNKEIKLLRILDDKNEILYSLGQKIISSLDIEKMISEIDKEIRKLVSADFFAIFAYDEDKNEIRATAMEQDKLNVFSPVSLELSSTFCSSCIKNKKLIVIDDIRKEYKKYVDNIVEEGRGIDRPISLMYIPLLVNDEIVGVMTIQSLNSNAYDFNDVNTAKIIANYVAISLKNSIKYKKVEEEAVYDSLTGFLTKREIINEGNKKIEEYRYSDSNLCIIMIDIDNFKHINDTYGHLAGDKVLKLVTQTISRQIGKNDLIGRYGGDEFLLICPNTNQKIAGRLSERIRKSVEEATYCIEDGLFINLTLSIGIYECDSKTISLNDSISHADFAMYKAKNNSKNKVVIY